MSRLASFDASAERANIAEGLLGSAARLISGRNEVEIVQGVCDTLIRITPHIRLVWTWFGPKNTPVIEPQIFAGRASSYARGIRIERNLLTQIGPAFKGLEGVPSEPFNISEWSLYGPWRHLAKEVQVKNVLALPVHSRFSGYSGVFVLYADANDYFNQVGVSLFTALGTLFSSVLTATSERMEVEYAAQHDALTGLLNRHALPRIEADLLRSSANVPAASVLLLDLDHFKLVNDQHGHHMGDLVLQATARTLLKTVRNQDSVVRWGGEEFMVCLPGTGLKEALQVAEKLRQAIAALTEPLPVTASIGVAELPPLRKLSQGADIADVGLGLAKAGGRNRVCLAP